MNCYFSKNYKNLAGAGNRAKRDMETILEGNGFRNIGSKPTFYSNPLVALVVTFWSVVKTMVRLKRGDMLFIQYPLKKFYSLLCVVARLKGAQTITLVHDLGSFRRRKLTPRKEIKRLSRSSCIIALNDSMKGWLVQQGCEVPIVSLEVWDYLSQTSAVRRESMGDERVVVYAGALSRRKNSFLYKIGDYADGYRFNLYGKGFEVDEACSADRFDCRGFVQSDKLIASVEGDFGLVWDGDSVEECSGDWGGYLRYNNPHKCSLYIRCELPLIVWREAAMARFVEREGIGVVVDSLVTLSDVLGNISADEYAQMKRNVVAVSNRLGEGYYIRSAVKKAMEML